MIFRIGDHWWLMRLEIFKIIINLKVMQVVPYLCTLHINKFFFSEKLIFSFLICLLTQLKNMSTIIIIMVRIACCKHKCYVLCLCFFTFILMRFIDYDMHIIIIPIDCNHVINFQFLLPDFFFVLRLALYSMSIGRTYVRHCNRYRAKKKMYRKSVL